MANTTAAVILASAGRAQLVGEVMVDLAAQTYPLVARILSVPDEASVPSPLPEGWTVVTGARGLAAQRNRGLDELGDADVVFFFDDDAVVRADYVERAVAILDKTPELVGLTGRVLLDGAAHSSGEVSRDESVSAVEASWSDPATGDFTRSRTLYGCNFAYYRSRVPDIRFDPRLPLYSWLEDHDFARRLMRSGVLGRVDDCVIVHRGASSGGRTNHVRLGYSQFMNPVYLRTVGSFPLWLSVWEIFRPTAKNVAYAVAGPQKAWRRERVRGNLMGLRDAIRGRIEPERITQL